MIANQIILFDCFCLFVCLFFQCPLQSIDGPDRDLVFTIQDTAATTEKQGMSDTL